MEVSVRRTMHGVSCSHEKNGARLPPAPPKKKRHIPFLVQRIFDSTRPLHLGRMI